MKKIALGLVFLLMIAFGFFQENLKVAINFQIDYLTRYPQLQILQGQEREMAISQLAPISNIDYYYNHKRFSFLYSLSKEQLASLKWAHTLLFTLAYLGMNLLAAKIWSKELSYRALLVFYGSLFFVSLLVYLFGVMIALEGPFYAIARKIIGVLQSPLPVLIIWLTKKLRNNLSISQ
jgi:hypothetical protein